MTYFVSQIVVIYYVRWSSFVTIVLPIEVHLESMESKKVLVQVFVVSDATGITAERVISAALVQFEEIRPIYNKFSYVQTEEKIDEVFSEAEDHDAIVIYSLVSEELRAYFDKKKRTKGRIYHFTGKSCYHQK